MNESSMDLLSKEDLSNLARTEASPCISFYMPTVRAGAEIQQNQIRFKNMIRQAQEKLEQGGLRSAEVAEFLEPAQELLNDEFFWRQQSDGLVAFLTPYAFHTYRLPLDFPEQVLVGKGLHLKPLLPLFNNDGRFFILALSQKKVRLLEGSRYSVSEIDLEGTDVPKGLAEALRFDDAEQQLRFQISAGAATGTATPGTFHGQGGAREDEARDLERYFNKVDQGLHYLLAEERVPLILAGVERLLPIYRRVSSYDNLMETGILGNPDDLSARDLHTRAWEIVEPHFKEAQQKAAALYQQQAGMQTGRASQDLNEILLAAYQGRVGQLFIPLRSEKWGRVDWSTGQVEFHEDDTLENVDLLDLAATQTILNGGEVYAVEPEELPVPAPSVAVFRY